jgi:hypothetical protein
MLMFLMLGAIQATSMVFAKQALATAAYEGAREAVRFEAATTDVQAACQHILTERGMVDTTITIDPVDLANAPRGSYVTVTVSAPSNTNSFLHGWYFGSQVLSGETVMMKEF